MRKRSFLGLAAIAAIGLVLHAWAGDPGQQNLIASYDWSEDDAGFGGLSAVEIDQDGLGITALTDRGMLYRGTIERGDNGQIRRIVNVTAHVLLGPDGKPLDDTHDDSEGLALGANGAFAISEEGPARVLAYAGPDAPAELLPDARAFAGMQHNSSLEAIAIDAAGALYTLPERSGALDRPFPVYRLATGQWTQPFDVPRDGTYLVTAADFGPDGRFYVLERSFQGMRGFQSRVRRFAVTGDTIDAGETVLETYLGQHGNLEGLSVWRDTAGLLRLTMVSDDNFRFFLRTSLVEYTVPD